MSCIHQKDGCTWKGGIAELNIHLETCLYDLIDCPNKCGKKVPNVSVDEHLNVFCTSMPRSCRHCGITTTGEDQAQHRNVCLKYPIPCPNDCDVGYVIRGEIDKHLNDCELSVVCCSFKDLGCRYMGTQVRVNKHMEVFLKEHLLLVSGVVAEQSSQMSKQAAEIQQLKEEKAELEERLKIEKAELEEKLMAELGQKIENVNTRVNIIQENEATLKRDLAKVKTEQVEQILELKRTMTTYIWIIHDFKEKMDKSKNGTDVCERSPPFSTHLNGYKLQGVLYLNGKDDGKGEYISLYIKLLKGDFDDGLMWPFIYKIKLMIIDQHQDINKAIHEEKLLDPLVNDETKQYFKKPSTTNSFYGFSKFLSHKDLYSRQLIKNDSLIIEYNFSF